MLPKCFNQPSTPGGGGGGGGGGEPMSSHLPQNLITSVYQVQICSSSIHLTITWAKNNFTHSLTLYSDFFCITIPLHPAPFSLFSNRGHGSKSIFLPHHYSNQRFKLHWDFSRAKFGMNSAEPDKDFYLAISRNSTLEFFLGDLPHELVRRYDLQGRIEEPKLLSRREHVFGHSRYVSTAKFPGSKHQIVIECRRGSLMVKVDGLTSLVVKRLAWKFRGHERIVVGRREVDFYWDVLNWVKETHGGRSNGGQHGIFIFQVGDHVGVCPEIIGPEKRLIKKNVSAGSATPASMPLSPPLSSSSVLQWAEESSECGRSSCSSATSRSGESGGGFSLLLYAWRKEQNNQILPAA